MLSLLKDQPEPSATLALGKNLTVGDVCEVAWYDHEQETYRLQSLSLGSTGVLELQPGEESLHKDILGAPVFYRNFLVGMVAEPKESSGEQTNASAASPASSVRLLTVGEMVASVDTSFVRELLPFPVPNEKADEPAASGSAEELGGSRRNIAGSGNGRGGQAAPTPKVDSDLWSSKDYLGYEAYARTIAELITHPDTVAPLTIGIKAPWGAGKTSLMKRVQHLLDGQAYLTEENRSGARQQGSDLRVTLQELLQELKRATRVERTGLKKKEDGDEELKLPANANPEGRGYGLPSRITVWFNAWKYQTSEQIWAGMAHCIISQVTARMKPRQRELFWLRLHARRIKAEEVRLKVYEAIARQLWPLALVVLVAVGVVIFVASAIQSVPIRYVVQGASVLSGLFGMIWKGWDKLGEKAAGTVKELVREPDYEGKMGYLHLVESDIREVLNLVTTARVAPVEGADKDSGLGDYDRKSKTARSRTEREKGGAPAGQPRAAVPTQTSTTKSPITQSSAKEKEKLAPLVVFVDDLDRCAPNKVAEVVEAINLFLCGDYPNCIFVLGMEPGMVAAALEVANKDVIAKAKEMGLVDGAAPVGWRFMEKIVQMPIMISPPTKRGRNGYVAFLTGVREWEWERAKRQSIEQSEQPGDLDSKFAGLEKRIDLEIARTIEQIPLEDQHEDINRYVAELKGQSLAEVEEKSKKLLAGVPEEKKKAAAEASKRVYAQAFSERDPAIAEFVREVAELVGGNPRQIKRYVNVFRFYSTLRHSLRMDGTVATDELPSDKVLAKFVAMSIQWPHAMDCLQCRHSTDEKGQTLSRLEYLEGKSAEIQGDDVAADTAWNEIVGEKGMRLESWAHARAFRMFLARGESLGKSRGHGLW